MPKWFDGVEAPTIALWCFVPTGAMVLAVSSFAWDSAALGDMVSRLAISLIMASWVLADAQKRGRQLCYEFGAFVFFLWPVVVPVYLFQTRRARAFLTILFFAGMLLIQWGLARALYTLLAMVAG